MVLNSDIPDDIENQDIDNDLYDETGNLVYDDQEGAERLEWDVNNKIRYIKRRSTSSKPDIEFVYDASMKYRVAQIAHYKNGTVKTTIYINDAAGNIVATYVQENGGEARLKEQYLYGATRLGTLRSATAGTLGNREYELIDHLSSVRATVSDLPVDGTADIRNAFDYYPYGMIARSWHSPEKYRFGFNGWERDDDMEKGDGNEYGTESRQYDSRTGRYSSVDPLAITLAAYSPYSHALGNPVRFVDSEGDWPKPSTALAKVGVSLPPFVAGLMDGLADSSPIGMVGMAWDIASDANFRNEMINAFTEIAKDPVGFIGAMFDDYKGLITRVMEGKATDDDMKRWERKSAR